jgi:hypothetical protein
MCLVVRNRRQAIGRRHAREDRRYFTKHAADERFVEQWFLVAIGDDDKAKGAVSKVIKAGEDVVEVVGRIPASNLASWGLTEGEVRLVLPGEQISR